MAALSGMRDVPFLEIQWGKPDVHTAEDLQAMRESLAEAMEVAVGIEADQSPERVEFNRIRKESGLKAALDWKNRQTGG